MSINYHWFHQLSFVFNCFMHGLQRVSHVSTMNCGGWSIWLLSNRISTALKCHRYALHIDSFISHFLHKSKEENGAKDYSANILQYLVSFNANYKINEFQTTNRRGQATIHNFSLTKGNYKKYTIRDSLRVVVTHENRLRSRDKKCKCSSAHNNNNAETT